MSSTLSDWKVNAALFHVGTLDTMSALDLPRNIVVSCEQLVHGRIIEEILSVAAETSADLIVMATRGRNGFVDALRGSTTEQVPRRVPCPVLTAPER